MSATVAAPPRKRKYPLGLEEKFQISVVQLLALHEARGHLLYAHVPNGLRRHKATAGKLKMLGVRAGVPDLMIWLPGGRSLALELKWGRGVVSEAQRDWHARMARLRHYCSVCWTLDDVQRALGAAGVPPLGRER